MNRPSLYRQTLFPVLFLMLSTVTVRAQNELVAADDAVQLRRVWTVQGEHLKADEYGRAVAGVPDITGDGIRDFAVYQQGNWLFYKGGNPPDTMVFLRMGNDSANLPPYTLLTGDFRGDGVISIGLVKYAWRAQGQTTQLLNRPLLYESGSWGVAEEPWVTGEYDCFLDMQSGDLDGESGDELMVMRGCSTKEVLIYRGGPEFQLESPEVIISDTGPGGNNAPDNWAVRFADFDGDGRMDMVMGGSYPEGGPMLRFYWGDENSPWSWVEREPDRDLPLVDGMTGMRDIQRFGIFQLDGDDAADIVGYTGDVAPGTYVYLSSRGDARSRDFTVDNADVVYADLGFSTTGIGPMNDRSGRYEMLPMGGTVGNNQIARLAVSGSAYGPDHDYEAWYAPGLDGLENVFIFQQGSAVGDVTGDGYGDMLYSDWTYGPFVNTGIAFLLSGGPEIPFDDTTVSVREYPVAGESGGLYLWPNPVVGDELHIAWRGNLRRMPSEFVVYDVEGREVVRGKVLSWRGSALWRCASVPSGCYVVVLRDAEGGIIGSMTIIKE